MFREYFRWELFHEKPVAALCRIIYIYGFTEMFLYMLVMRASHYCIFIRWHFDESFANKSIETGRFHLGMLESRKHCLFPL